VDPRFGWDEVKKFSYFIPAYHVALCVVFLFFY